MRKFEKVERLKETDIKLPERSTKNSAGHDFFAIDRIEIPPLENLPEERRKAMLYGDW